MPATARSQTVAPINPTVTGSAAATNPVIGATTPIRFNDMRGRSNQPETADRPSGEGLQRRLRIPPCGSTNEGERQAQADELDCDGNLGALLRLPAKPPVSRRCRASQRCMAVRGERGRTWPRSR